MTIFAHNQYQLEALSIHKDEDDYFWVKIEFPDYDEINELLSDEYYKCDGFRGLRELLKYFKIV